MKEKLLELYYKSCEKRPNDINPFTQTINYGYNSYEYYPTIVDETDKIEKILAKYNSELLNNAKLEGYEYEGTPLYIRSNFPFDVSQIRKISFDNEPPLYISKVASTYHIFITSRYKLKKYFLKKKKIINNNHIVFNNMKSLISDDIKYNIDYGDVLDMTINPSLDMTFHVINYKLSFGMFEVNISKEEYEKGLDIISESIKTNTENQLIKNIENLNKI
jgi:hypothetical protein